MSALQLQSRSSCTVSRPAVLTHAYIFFSSFVDATVSTCLFFFFCLVCFFSSFSWLLSRSFDLCMPCLLHSLFFPLLSFFVLSFFVLSLFPCL